MPLQQSGTPLPAEKLADVVQQTTEAYYKLTELVTLTFAAVSVLVSYQQKSGSQKELPGPLIAGSLICLGLALLLALYSREVLLEMISNNAINLTEPTLSFGRELIYSLLIAGIALMGLFAMRLALGTEVPGTGMQSANSTT